MDKVKEEKKCEFYDDYECNAYYNIYPEPQDCQRDLCRTHKDCYYRQLKRKEQECEKLKWLIETKCESELDKENSELKAENERLKEENNDLCKALKDKEFDRLIQSERKLKNLKQANIYRQALQEIRDIALIGEHCEGVGCDFMPKILTKINEVIGE